MIAHYTLVHRFSDNVKLIASKLATCTQPKFGTTKLTTSVSCGSCIHLIVYLLHQFPVRIGCIAIKLCNCNEHHQQLWYSLYKYSWTKPANIRDLHWTVQVTSILVYIIFVDIVLIGELALSTLLAFLLLHSCEIPLKILVLFGMKLLAKWIACL